MKNLRDLRNQREIKKSSVRKLSQISQISTDFQNINDVWISGISGICVGKIFSVKVRTLISLISQIFLIFTSASMHYYPCNPSVPSVSLCEIYTCRVINHYQMSSNYVGRLNGINPETYLEKLFKCIVSKETYDKLQLLPCYIKI